MKKDPYVHHVNEAASFISSVIGNTSFVPKLAITLGSGLGKLASLISPVAKIPYKEIPHFPQSTVAGHEGTLIAGYFGAVPLIGFSGRKHYYEVARLPDAMDIVTFPVHVAASLGCATYIATNAAGGLNPNYSVGDLMVISSHIGMFLPSPLLGEYHDFGSSAFFQPQNGEYSPKLRALFRSIDRTSREGVYVAVTGRAYETKAECLWLRSTGADAVGMSTIPEIIVAENRGMETFAVSMITNIIAKDGTNATNHEEVMSILKSSSLEEKLLRVFGKFISSFAAG